MMRPLLNPADRQSVIERFHLFTPVPHHSAPNGGGQSRKSPNKTNEQDPSSNKNAERSLEAQESSNKTRNEGKASDVGSKSGLTDASNGGGQLRPIQAPLSHELGPKTGEPQSLSGGHEFRTLGPSRSRDIGQDVAKSRNLQISAGTQRGLAQGNSHQSSGTGPPAWLTHQQGNNHVQVPPREVFTNNGESMTVIHRPFVHRPQPHLAAHVPLSETLFYRQLCNENVGFIKNHDTPGSGYTLTTLLPRARSSSEGPEYTTHVLPLAESRNGDVPLPQHRDVTRELKRASSDPDSGRHIDNTKRRHSDTERLDTDNPLHWMGPRAEEVQPLLHHPSALRDDSPRVFDKEDIYPTMTPALTHLTSIQQVQVAPEAPIVPLKHLYHPRLRTLSGSTSSVTSTKSASQNGSNSNASSASNSPSPDTLFYLGQGLVASGLNVANPDANS